MCYYTVLHCIVLHWSHAIASYDYYYYGYWQNALVKTIFLYLKKMYLQFNNNLFLKLQWKGILFFITNITLTTCIMFHLVFSADGECLKIMRWFHVF